MSSFTIKLRQATSSDVDSLHDMITNSIGSESLTASSLRNELFPDQQTVEPEVVNQDASIELEPHLFKQSVEPLTQAIVAQADDQLIGYVIFHYYYSPWLGHGVFIDDIYVRSCFINKRQSKEHDVASMLIQEVITTAKRGNLKMILSNNSKLNSICSDIGEQLYCVRGPETDWSVIRIEFDKY